MFQFESLLQLRLEIPQSDGFTSSLFVQLSTGGSRTTKNNSLMGFQKHRQLLVSRKLREKPAVERTLIASDCSKCI